MRIDKGLLMMQPLSKTNKMQREGRCPCWGRLASKRSSKQGRLPQGAGALYADGISAFSTQTLSQPHMQANSISVFFLTNISRPMEYLSCPWNCILVPHMSHPPNPFMGRSSRLQSGLEALLIVIVMPYFISIPFSNHISQWNFHFLWPPLISWTLFSRDAPTDSCCKISRISLI